MNMKMEKLYKNKEWLEKKYIKEELSSHQIAKLCGISGTIYWLHKLNIPIRSGSESTHLRRANHCNLSQEAIEWLNGELLGDGCLLSQSIYSAEFKYGSKYLEYAQYVSDTLKFFGVKQSGKIRKCCNKKLGNYSYHYQSCSYVELLSIRKKWYPEGKKIVPKDIKLTSLTCRQWVIGDGSLMKSKAGSPYIKLATCGFIISDVKWLIKQLKNLNFKVTRWPSCNTISISIYSTKDFLDYIGKSPVECYSYKFNY